MDALLSIGIGIGLSAACGFRVFVPFLIAGLAARAGYLSPSPEFAWLGATPAIIAFATAALLEVLAYYIPWLDNALDVIATPVATVAGMLASAVVFTDLPPLVKWSLAIIAGGAVAGVVQGSTTILRLKSSLASVGIGNPIIATGELFGAVAIAVLALAFPLACLLLLVGLGVAIWRFTGRFFAGMKPSL
jgi:Domain of unknown function (DUF4126)